MLRNIFKFLAWGSLATIFIATDFSMGLRPPTVISPNADRFAALAVVAMIFSLAYPLRLLLIGLFLTVAVIAFEFGQIAIPGRHAELDNVIVKLAGVGLGMLLAFAINRLFWKVSPQSRNRRPSAADDS